TSRGVIDSTAYPLSTRQPDASAKLRDVRKARWRRVGALHGQVAGDSGQKTRHVVFFVRGEVESYDDLVEVRCFHPFQPEDHGVQPSRPAPRRAPVDKQ